MSTATTSRYLDLRALSALEGMRFATRHRIEGSYSGRHRSRQQGGSGEFVDFREYTGGEDLRRLDWKVLARTGKAFIRMHQEETNLRCTLALDASGSMRFGEGSRFGSKLDYAKYLATALSHVIAAGQDEVGLAVLTDELHEALSPGNAPTHVGYLQSRIEAVATRPTRTMGSGLRQLFEQSSGRGVLLLISDMLAEDLDDIAGAVRLFRHRSWEVIVLHLVHPEEERLPQGLAFRFEGLEGEGRLDCSPAAIRNAYERRFADHLTGIRQMALAAGCDYRRVSLTVDYLHTLGRFLVARAG